MLRVALALVLGLALGVGMGWFAAPGTDPVVARPTPAASAAVPRTTEPAPPVDPPLRRPEPDARSAPAPEKTKEPRERESAGDGLFSPTLLAFAGEGLRTGWKTRRVDGIPDERHAEGRTAFEEAVLALPEQIGARLADEQSAREKALADAQAGGAFALLAALAEGGAPVPELVTNAEAFDALLPRNHTGPTVQAESALGNLAEALEDGVTLSFPAGVFELKRFLSLKTPFPDDVTLTGAGMNTTLLVLGTDWMARSPVRRLELRDCTIFTDSDSLIDQRSGEVTIALERVRLIGTDSGAGGSVALDLNSGGVVRARDCRFEGGYGRSPGGAAQLFRQDGSSPIAARFERCTVSRLHLSTQGLTGGTTIVFDACYLVEMLTFYRKSQVFEDPPPGLILASGTTVTTFDSESGDVPALDLNDLFPDWKARMVRK